MMSGNRGLLWLLVVAGCMLGCSPEHPQQTHNLQACENVRAQGSFQLTLLAGTQAQLVLQGPDAQLQTSVIEESPSGLLINAPGADVKAELVCPGLTELELIGAVRASGADQALTLAKLAAYGSSAVALATVQADDLDIRTSGAAGIEVVSVLAESVHLQSSSNSRVLLAGETGRLQISLLGQAQLDAAELSAQWVEVSVLDDSSARVHASAHLSGEVAESGSLRHTGTPDLDLRALEE